MPRRVHTFLNVTVLDQNVHHNTCTSKSTREPHKTHRRAAGWEPLQHDDPMQHLTRLLWQNNVERQQGRCVILHTALVTAQCREIHTTLNMRGWLGQKAVSSSHNAVPNYVRMWGPFDILRKELHTLTREPGRLKASDSARVSQHGGGTSSDFWPKYVVSTFHCLFLTCNFIFHVPYC